MRLSVTNRFTGNGIPLSLGNCFPIECMKGQVWWPRIKYCANTYCAFQIGQLSSFSSFLMNFKQYAA